MENEQDKKTKDKQIPEEELFDELDAMYQRVADIEKEEATKVSSQEEVKNKNQGGLDMGSKKKSGQNGKRPYRPIILGAIAVLFALILAITFWKPTAVLQLLNLGGTQQPTLSTPIPPRPRKPPSIVTPAAPPAPPSIATSQTPPPPPPVAASSAPPPSPPKSLPAQAKQEAVNLPREETEKAKPISQEIVKLNKPTPRGKYFAIQVGSFHDMENVRDLVGVLKKEGLDAYWITMKSKKSGALYRVLVGQFMDTNEAAQFLKDKKILKNYPDSFIQEISSSKIIDGSMK
jgi:cell division septation protein DedD